MASQYLPVRFHPLEVTNAEGADALREFLDRTFGRLDVLINNAGITCDDEASGLEVKLSTLRITLETNALGPLQLSQTLTPVLKRS